MNEDNLPKTIKTIVDDSALSAYQVLIIILCFVLNFNDGIDVLLVSFTGSSIAHDLLLSKTELGYVFSAGLAGMTAGCFLLAPFGDRIGRRPVFILSLLLITTGMFCVYITNSYGQLLLCRGVTGLGIGGILPNLTTIASEFSNKKTRDFNVGAVQAGWPLGAILAGFVTASILPAHGWKFAYAVSGTFSLTMLLAIIIFLPESPLFLIEKQPANALIKLNKILLKIGKAPLPQLPPKPTITAKAGASQLFSANLKTTTLLLWCGIFLIFLTLYTVLSWVPNVAKEAGMPVNMSIYVGTTLNAGSFAGTLIMGLAISKYNIKKVMAIFMVAGFAGMMVFGNIVLPYTGMFIVAFFIGFFVQGGFNLFYPATARIYPGGIRSTGVGWAMGIGRFGAIIGPALFGILQDADMHTGTRFFIFSLPLLLTAWAVYKIPGKNIARLQTGVA